MKRFLKIVAVFSVSFLGLATVTHDHGKYFEISKNIEIFTNLYKEINTYYVDEVDPANLMRIGVDAILNSLDPYTNYISESEIEGFRYITEGKYNGIGAMIKSVDDKMTITETYENCPAHNAGLKSGDVILSIDGKSTEKKTSDDISNILKGFPGTEVELIVDRPGESKSLKIALVRDEVNVPNVPYHGMVSNGVGYVALTTFTRDAGRHVAEAIKALKEEDPNLKGVIFDLRGNGGGLLTEAVNVSNVFIPKGELVVTTKGKVADWDRSFKTLNPSIDEDIPLVVLVDKGSASASEIVSGVIQDLDRGVLMGQQSFGKGLVQNTRDVGYNSKVKLTTAKYYIPSKRCIQGVMYENGEPVDIPDSLRTAFKTKNGRTVLDGGGIKPDLELDKLSDNMMVKSLLKDHVIFNFVTQYLQTKGEITDVENFHFDSFDSFVSFVDKQNYSYKTESEDVLNRLKSKAKSEHLLESISSELKNIEAKIEAEKKGDLLEHKEAITDLIEKEVASRFGFQKGKIKMGLRNDIEIKEAVKLLSDNKTYNQLLGN